MLTHAEINARFVALDREPVLLHATLDGWLAWPIVKERLWLLCLNWEDGPRRRSLGPVEGMIRLTSGAVQLATNLAFAGRREGALLYEPRQIRLPDGRCVHPHLGELSRIEAAGPWLHYRHAWNVRRLLFPRFGIIEDAGTGALAAAAAVLIRRSAAVRSLASQLVDVIAPAVPEFDRATLFDATLDHLGRFRTRFALARQLLRRWQVRQIVVLDPDGKVPEVAAAKSLGLPVTEVQHGMFSAREPDYSWGAEHRALPCQLPLPDRVVVFGPFWADQLRRAGFWRDDEIIEAQNPILGTYRRLRGSRPRWKADAPLRILFSSQDYIRSTAIPFWHRVLSLQAESGENRIHLRIKIHPLELGAAAAYQSLVDSFPGHASIAAPNSEAFDEMLEADVAAGYTSFMLVEAIGIGIPVLGLRGGAAREGLGATFDAPVLTELVPAFETPDEMWSAIAGLTHPGRYEALAAKTLRVASQIYDLDGPDVESVILQ